MVPGYILVRGVASQGRRSDARKEPDHRGASWGFRHKLGEELLLRYAHLCRRISPKHGQRFVHQLVNSFYAAIIIEAVSRSVGGKHISALSGLALGNVGLYLGRNRQKPVANRIASVLNLMGVAHNRNELFLQALDYLAIGEQEPPVPKSVVSRTA